MMTTQEINLLRSDAYFEQLNLKNTDRMIALVEAEIAHRLLLEKDLKNLLPDPEAPPTKFTSRDKGKIDGDLWALYNGVAPDMGVTDSRLVRLIGQPGLTELQRASVRLRAHRETEAAKPVLSWPRPFRYTGLLHQHTMDGRSLRPGETVMLSQQQASAFADRFEEAESHG
jgi:hypothetical protein